MKKQKPTRRNQSQHPALNRKLNLPSRRDFIETEYINGVFDKEGNQLLRPLTQEEKQWLNSFYEETVNANFLHDDELKRLSLAKKKIIEDTQVIDLKNEVKEVKTKKEKNRLMQIIKELKKQNEETYEKQLRSIEKMMQNRRDKVLHYNNKEEHKQFYKANNDRNICLLNKLNTSQEIRPFDCDEYDLIAQQTLDAVDFEDFLIDQIENPQVEEIEEIELFSENVQYLPKRRK